MSDSVLENPQRRQFFGALFKQEDPSRSVFQRIENNPFPSQCVIWATIQTDSGDILFAGDDGIILRYSENTWVQEQIDTNLPIHALVRGEDDVFYGVGWLGLICERRDGVWHILQGGKRTAVGDSSENIRANLPLFDVAKSRSGAIWAVGDQGRIVCRQDHAWSEIDSGVDANLRCALALDDGSMMFAGAGGVVLHLVDGQWQQIETNTQCPILSMVSMDETNIFAVGGDYSAELGSFVGRVFHYDGKIWSELSLQNSLPRLRRIRAHQQDIYIVGDGGTAIKMDQTGAVSLKTKVGYDLHNVITLNSGETFFCGDGGCVLEEAQESGSQVDGNPILQPDFRIQPSWQIVAKGLTKKTLRGVWSASHDRVFAVGDAGTILSFNGTEWLLEDTPLDIRLYAVWGSSANNVYAVGENASVLHFDGDSWSVCYRGDVDEALLAITGFGPHDIYAVGDSGFALRFNGLHWQRVETGTQYELYGLWGHDSDHLLAVGGAGVLVRWNGEKWQTFNVGTDDDIFGVWGRSLTDIYFCGLSSTMIHFDGQTWDKESAGVRLDIHAVAGSTNGKLYAAGSQGVVLRRTNGQWEPEQSVTDVTLRAITVTDKSVYAVGTDGCIISVDIE